MGLVMIDVSKFNIGDPRLNIYYSQNHEPETQEYHILHLVFRENKPFRGGYINGFFRTPHEVIRVKVFADDLDESLLRVMDKRVFNDD
jgi:hypothetical protein